MPEPPTLAPAPGTAAEATVPRRRPGTAAALRLALTLALAGFLVWSVAVAPPAAEDRALAIGTLIRCPVCQGESIADSNAGLAQDMMGLVRQRIAEGWTDDQIIDELLASYSGSQLLDPPLTGGAVALVAIPALVLVGGVALIVRARVAGADGGDEAADGGAGAGSGEADSAAPRSRRRSAVGAAVLAVGLGAAVYSAVTLLEDRGDGVLQGAAAGDTFDPTAFSDETLEAVVASAENDPAVADELPFMRFALAERYFEKGDYQKAFPHYQTILDGDPPPPLAASVLTRLGWIVWVGNGEAQLAVGLFDRAIEADPTNPEPVYTKARVTWCGLADPEGAATLFGQVLGFDSLDADVRTQVEDDLAAARAGEACP